MADKHGLAEHWLNDAAGAWIPPRPVAARRRPREPGLTVHIAPPEDMLAMKLVALRRKDRPDIRLPATILRPPASSRWPSAGGRTTSPCHSATAASSNGPSPTAPRARAGALVSSQRSA